MASESKIGSYTGTGAAIDVELGWVPDYIRIWNATDGDETYEWFSGMAAANALKTANHASTQLALITSNGITALNPKDFAKKKGFTVGTAISESTKVFRYIAVRNAEF